MLKKAAGGRRKGIWGGVGEAHTTPYALISALSAFFQQPASMRRRVETWSWRETFVALGGAFCLAFATWLAASTSLLPGPTDPRARRGAEIFRREQCAFCHTLSGASFSEASYLTRSGPDLREEGRLRSDDWHLAHLVSPGAVVAGSTMPSFSDLPPQDMRDLIAYMQSLSPAPRAERAPETIPSAEFTVENYQEGSRLFRLHCAGCHGEGGRGNGIVGPLLQPEPHDLTDGAWLSKKSDAPLFSVISDGLASTAMPGFRDVLSAYERTLVVHYLRYLGDPVAKQFIEQGFLYPLATP